MFFWERASLLFLGKEQCASAFGLLEDRSRFGLRCCHFDYGKENVSSVLGMLQISPSQLRFLLYRTITDLKAHDRVSI